MKRFWHWLSTKKQHFWGLGALFIAVVLFSIAMDWVVMPIYIHLGSEKELPDITEHSYNEAKSILEENGFRIVKDREVFVATYPESTVIYQNPPAFALVKNGRRVYVTLSAGEKQVTVPNIVGISERDARFRLRQAGLDVAEDAYYEYDDYRPKGVVKGQSLMEGTEVREHATIALTISNGPLPTAFLVPDLSGKSLKVARQMLRQNGLMLGVIRYRVRRDLIPETVIEQTLEPGTEVEQGQFVDLVVSKLEEDVWEE